MDIHRAIDIGSSQKLDDWITGNRIAYFFLDSVDEARLSGHNAFRLALNQFSNSIGNNLNRAKIFISCRVSNWRATADLDLFLKYFPENIKSESDEKKEEKLSSNPQNSTKNKENHIVYQLAPLNDQQVQKFALYKGIKNTKSFIEAIERADARIFAERPQDLLDLISYWKSKNQLGSHFEMLAFNIQKKLIEIDPERDEVRPLSSADALLGAERLAAAITLQKKNYFILPDKPIDSELYSISVNPKEVLPEWLPDKIQILLDRAIFDEAIYGTVKFHHRSVREYLTAIWIKKLINSGRSRRLIDDMIFSEKYGVDVVIPSMEPIAAWLSLWDDGIKNKIRKTAPEVLIEHGDPSSLPIEFRKLLLIEFATYYANREYTGASFDVSMVRRLADSLLSSTVNNLLQKYKNNDDTCSLLLKIFKVVKPPEELSSSTLQYSIEEMVDNADIPEKDLKILLRGLFKLLKKRQFVNKHHCDISGKYFWLLPIAIKFINIFIRTRHSFSFEPMILDLFLNFLIAQHYGDYYIHDSDKLLKEAKAWEEFRYQLFWHEIDITRNREKDINRHPTFWWQVSWEIDNFWSPRIGNLEMLQKRNEKIFGLWFYFILMD